MINPEAKAIAIIGVACKLPGECNTPKDFWKLLINKRDGITDIPSDRWDVDAYYDPNPRATGKMYTKKGGFIKDVDKFDATFFKIFRNEAETIDPQQRLLLETAWQAIEDANIPPRFLSTSNTGVFVGISSTDYGNLLAQYSSPEELNAHYVAGKDNSAAAGRISYILGLEGPSLSIDTATSSSLVAVHYACKELLTGSCYLALAGGVNLILAPEPTIYRCRAKMLSPDGYCKAFDESANGYTRAEGCVMIVLKRLSDAIKDDDNIIAVIRGSSVRQDGTTKGFTMPNPKAQANVIKAALEDAGIKPDQISHIEAHGTGTEIGDPIEIKALTSVFGGTRLKNNPLYITSVKNNVGHLESAAGITSLIKVAMSLQNRKIPAHIHFQKLNPAINLQKINGVIPTELTEWESPNKLLIAGISSIGLNGTNCHLILSEAPKRKPIKTKQRPYHLLALSAKDGAALQIQIKNYLQYIEENPDVEIGNLCYSANSGRTHFEERLTVIAKDIPDLIKKLNDGLQNNSNDFVSYGSVDPNLDLSFTVTDVEIGAVRYSEKQWLELFRSLSQRFLAGFDIKWDKVDKPYASKKIHLPTYPFQRQRYWAKMLDHKNDQSD